MLSIRHVLAVAAATTLLGIGLPATASANTIPADCTVTDEGHGATMTCTDRPAEQHWHAFAFCAIIWGGGITMPGTPVVGNGSSTAVCPAGGPFNMVFTPE